MMSTSALDARKQLDLSFVLIAGCGFLFYLQSRFLVKGFLTNARWSDLDGQHWLFAVISRMRGGGFTNHLTPFVTGYSEVDGPFSLVGYPPVHLLATYSLATSSDIFGVLFSIAFIDGVALILVCLLFLLVIRKHQAFTSKLVLFCALVLLTVFFLLDFGGRPESTFVVFLALFLLYGVWSDWLGQPWLFGLFLGLMGATAPTAALLVSALSVSIVGLKRRFFDGVCVVAKMAAAAAITFLLLLDLRYGILNSLESISQSFTSQLFAYPSWELFLKTNFLDWYRPLFGTVFIIGTVVFGLRLRVYYPTSLSLFLFGLFLFSILGYQAFWLRPHCTYNLLALTPIFLLLILETFIRTKKARLPILAFLFLPLVGFLVQIGLYIDYQNRGLTLTDARSIVAEITRQVPTDIQVGLDPLLWLLADSVEDHSRVFLWNEKSLLEKVSNAILIIKEGFGFSYGGSLTSPPLQHIRNSGRAINHSLILDCTKRDTLRLFGKDIYQPIYGYGFTLYVPVALAENFKHLSQMHTGTCRPEAPS